MIQKLTHIYKDCLNYFMRSSLALPQKKLCMIDNMSVCYVCICENTYTDTLTSILYTRTVKTRLKVAYCCF